MNWSAFRDDRDRNAVAGTEEFWRVEAKADACRCAGCNDVAGLQGETCGNRRYLGMLRLDIAAFLADDERKLGQRAPG